MGNRFDEWWDANEKQFIADAYHMSEYHMAGVVWRAAQDAKGAIEIIEGALSSGDDATGLCTVRDAAALQHAAGLPVNELAFQHDGKWWNVGIHILKVVDMAPGDETATVKVAALMTPNAVVQADSRGFMREVAPGTES